MDRPLHVKVAEALGWTRCRLDHADVWIGMAPGHDDYAYNVPHYDTDWSVAGPLIERLELEIGKEWTERPFWTACANTERGLSWEDGIGGGDTPLLAVCNLIVTLHAAGKLPKVSA